MAEEKKEEELTIDSKPVVHTYPLIRFSDMPEDIRVEVMEMIVTACEKHSANHDVAAKFLKESMDKKYGPPWHVVVGEGFGFQVSYELKNIMYLFSGGDTGICVWKCS